MFGGIGGALKGLSSKAEEMIEKTKTSVGEMAAEKKAAAAAMIEAQAKKTSEVLWQTKGNVEADVTEGAAEAKAAAIDGFDKELANAEKVVDEGLTEKPQPSKPATEGGATAGFDPAKLLASGVMAGGIQNVEKDIEKVVDDKLKEVSQTVDNKIKETDQFLDQKREEVVKTVQDETQKAASATNEGFGSVLGKAKGLLNF